MTSRSRVGTRAGRTRIAAAAACLGLCGLLVTSCASDGIYSLPLPGGADIGSDPMKIDVRFDDVLDLVPQAAVKVDGVPVGRVDSIKVAKDGWTADVRALVKSSVRLPVNAHAEVKQTNLLGEKFVELSAPKEAPSGRLADGASIPIERTRHATEIEQVLGALSLLLNGGGVAQLQPIVTELNKTLGGRENRVRSLLTQANTLIGGLEKQVTDIQVALDGLAKLSTRTSRQTEQLGKALDELPEGIKILDEQRPALVTMLGQLDRLGKAGYAVIGTSKNDLIRDLRALRPTLQELGKAAPDLITAFPLVPTYPFPDSSLESTFGGQMNTWLSVDLQLGTMLSTLGVGKPDPVYYKPYGRKVPVNPTNPYYNGNGPASGWPSISLVPLAPNVPRPEPPTDPISAIITQLGGGHR